MDCKVVATATHAHGRNTLFHVSSLQCHHFFLGIHGYNPTRDESGHEHYEPVSQ